MREVLNPVAPIELKAEHAEALRNVDLQLRFGNHGYDSAMIEHGLAVLAVTDAEYALTESYISDLDAQRGDVLTHEGIGHGDQLPAEGLIGSLHWSLGGSPYLANSDISFLEQNRGSKPCDIIANGSGAEFLDLWEKLRSYQLISPIHYASGIALGNNVACEYADATDNELHNWWSTAEDAVKSWPKLATPFAQLVGLRFALAEQRFRDSKTVASLGRIAAQMKKVTEDQPVLMYLGGNAHRKNLERILMRNDIPFESQSFYPDREKRLRQENARNLAHLLFRVVDSSHTNYEKLWIANAQSQTD